MSILRTANFESLLTPKTSMILFSILVVGTPFIMLQNYLQLTFRNIGGTLVNIFGIEIPLVLLITIPPLLVLCILNIKKLTLFRLSAALFTVLMLYIGQSVSDFYINYKFYDLQNNWHYIAYCLYTIIMFRYMITKNVPLPKIIILTLLRGMAISLFDEGIQVFISGRIFDLSDIAKDLWGLWLGNIFIFFFVENGRIWKEYKILHKKCKEYFSSPLSLIFFQGLFTFIFLYFSAKLTDSNYWLQLIFIFLLASSLLFFIIHLMQKKLFRIVFISLSTVILIVLSISFFTNKSNGLMDISNNFVVYSGLPIYYFDVLITPDGCMKLVDKKEHLKKGDILKLYDYKPDIMIFTNTNNPNVPNILLHNNSMKSTYFTYNPYTKTGVQVLILNYEDAIKEYNRLSKSKRVLIVIYNNDEELG